MSRPFVLRLAGLLVLFAGLSFAWGADDKENPAHEKLRELRKGVEKAVNENKIDDLLKYLHPNVVIVWQDGTTSRGHKGVKEYYQKHLGKSDSTLLSFTIEDVEPAELTIPYGDTGISWGTMTSRFKFRDGKTFDLKGPWSATLVKEDGKWVIASVHASAPLFDNPIVHATMNSLYMYCGIAAGGGLLVGLLVMALFRRRSTV
jgi:ketosteroid isomerase-like protein